MKTILLSVFLSVAIVGCGGGASSSSSTTTTTPPASTTEVKQMNGGALAGFHGSVAKTTTTHSFSLLPKVYAQTTTNVSLTGTFSGYMSALPPTEIPPPTVTVAYPVYGVGSFDSYCQAFPGGSISQSQLCPFAAATSTMSPGQALAAQALTSSASSNLNPAVVTGSGTIGPLVVYGNAVSTAATTDPIEIWVLRGGVVMNTGISCHIPSGTVVGATPQRCISTSTFSVQDSDQIVATITMPTTDAIYNLNFYLVKD